MDSSLTFDYISEDDFERWNHFIDESSEGSIYAKTWYLEAVGLPFRIGVVSKSGNWLGGIVLAKNELRCYSNPLFVKYLGVVYGDSGGKDYTKMSQQVAIAEKIVDSIRDIKTFDYTFHPSFTNWLPFYWAGYHQQTRYTYQIERNDFDLVRSRFKQTVRTQERKAVKSGIVVRSDVSPERFYRIVSLSFQRQGSPPPFSFRTFFSYYSLLQRNEAIQLIGGYLGEDLYAVAGIVYDRKSANLVFNGTDPHYTSSAANVLVIVEAIKSGFEKAAIFDFEGSMIKPIEFFYRGFGGQLVPYFNIWKPNIWNNAKRKMIGIYKRIKYRL
ncbi:MAG: GNAT family N-acetyltransferase [Deltaproteobacteria bacterium]|nr:GNAT family N-acetyltransferase [Deltaproteobacteria bacterium]